MTTDKKQWDMNDPKDLRIAERAYKETREPPVITHPRAVHEVTYLEVYEEMAVLAAQDSQIFPAWLTEEFVEKALRAADRKERERRYKEFHGRR